MTDNNPIDPLEIFGDDSIPDFDPNEEFVIDKFGKELPRCHRIKNDGKRCRSYVYTNRKEQIFSNFCKMHGGPSMEGRAAAGQTQHQIQIPFKEFFDAKFDLYLRELKQGHFRYSIDREIAALKAEIAALKNHTYKLWVRDKEGKPLKNRDGTDNATTFSFNKDGELWLVPVGQ